MHTALIPSQRERTSKESSQPSFSDVLSNSAPDSLWSPTRAAKYIQVQDLMLLSSTLSLNPKNPLMTNT